MTSVGIRATGWKLLVASALIAITGIVAYSRVYLWYHTSYQVLAGLVVGSVVAVGYFVGLRYGVRRWGWAQWFVQTPLARYLYLRDPAETIPYLLQREYTWHCQATARARKQD
ncbi:hypothetical protein H4R35_000342 [Dimargaris xerosporica]|nr:hypothetical protein H4R35_000342 [Dimargaris xerosporica]